MIINIHVARKLLDYPQNKELRPILIRKYFRIAIMKGHSDRGGNSDMKLLCLARDCLLNQFLQCSKCIEPAVFGETKCRYHLS